MKKRPMMMLLMGIVLGLVTGVASSAQVQEKILFTASAIGGSSRTDLWMANPDGTDPLQLTDYPGRAANARFSPDGSQIAFLWERDGGVRPWVMNVGGTGLQPLSSELPVFGDGAYAHWLGWSPSGDELVVLQRMNPNSTWYRVGIDGTIAHQHDFSGRASLGDWIPGIDQVIYETETSPNNASTQEIWLADPNGSGSIRLTNNSVTDNQPRVSPQGGQVLFNRGGATNDDWRIWQMNIDGSSQAQVPLGQAAVFYPAWSPLGTDLIYSRLAGDYDIWRAGIDGSSQVEVLSWPGQQLFPSDWASIPGPAVPEPMTMLAVGLGITGLGGYIRKRRRA